MRAIVGTVLIVLALAGCSKAEEKKARAADARVAAAGFVPPSIITRLDYGSAQERRFRRYDRNDDDALVPSELPAKNSPLMQLDRNGDGKITEIEWSEGMLSRFDKLDTNHDSALTSEERRAGEGKPLAPELSPTANTTEALTNG